MNKYLLGTTALAVTAFMAAPVLAADAAKKLQLGVGGFMEHAIGFAANENTTGEHLSNWAIESDAELLFRGRITLDNGLKFDARFELEANRDNETVSVDEMFVQISSPSLGLIEIGSTDPITDTIAGKAPKVGWGLTDADDWIPNKNVSSESDWLGGDVDALSVDSKKINYFTPSDWQKKTGFQAAIGFTPQLTPTGTNNATFNMNGGNDSNAGTAWAAGLVFDRKIGGVDVYSDYAYYRSSDDVEGGNDGGVNSVDGHQFGLELKQGPWFVGGSYVKYNVDKTASATTLDGYGVSAGVAYTTGKWQFGVSYGRVVTEGTVAVAKNDTYETWDIAAKYDLGKGISWRNSLYVTKQDEENDVDANEAGTGVAFVTGVVIGF